MSGNTRVLATGVFDLLHEEHKEFLRKAAQLGDALVVGVESDVRVRQLKGPGRPVQPEGERRDAVAALAYVHSAFILPEQFSDNADHEALIAKLRPNILAVSSHTPFIEVKQKILAKYGGVVVVVHQHNPAISTTQIIQHQNDWVHDKY